MEINALLKSITGIALDSRRVTPGMLFCAYPGEKMDGRDFIPQAIANGATYIAYEPKHFTKEAQLRELAKKNGVSFIPISDLSHQVGIIAAHRQAAALEKLSLIGVTGTNGKTSITHYLGQAWSHCQKPCGVLGTVGYGIYFEGKALELTPLNLTTPDPVTLVDCLAQMQQSGAKRVAMEVSAHALTQGRVSGLNYETAIFTNLTQDHLDYYGTLENYGQAKAQLFTWPSLKFAVLNWDDPFSATLCKKIKAQVVAYSIEPLAKNFPQYFVQAVQIETLAKGYAIKIVSSWGEAVIRTGLIGRFNASNLLATLSVLLCHGVAFEKAIEVVSQLQPVPGRMQLFGGNGQPLVIVDYAHTPDALEKALLAAREHLRGKLICVFGCGGERDTGKRPRMAQIAQKNADYIVVTQDNPRAEAWEVILSDIQQGFTKEAAVIAIAAREEAIRHAISKAQRHDVILLAGKGHETYQIIGNQQIEFDDRVWVQRILQENKE